MGTSVSLHRFLCPGHEKKVEGGGGGGGEGGLPGTREYQPSNRVGSRQRVLRFVDPNHLHVFELDSGCFNI